jgi:hypothetical protein
MQLKQQQQQQLLLQQQQQLAATAAAAVKIEVQYSNTNGFIDVFSLNFTACEVYYG